MTEGTRLAWARPPGARLARADYISMEISYKVGPRPRFPRHSSNRYGVTWSAHFAGWIIGVRPGDLVAPTAERTSF